jgi:hypothetical protein
MSRRRRSYIPCGRSSGYQTIVDEVAEVQDEAETVRGRRPLVLEDHPAVGVLGALVHVLAAHESERRRAPSSSRGAVTVRPTRLPWPARR